MRFMNIKTFLPIAICLIAFDLNSHANGSEKVESVFAPEHFFEMKEIDLPGAIVGKFTALPKDRRILYAATKTGTLRYNALNIYITDYETGQSWKIAGPGSWNPILSPDGENIGYNQIDLSASLPKSEDDFHIKNDVYLMDVHGGKKRILTDNGHSSIDKWNENGKKIYFSTGRLNEESGYFLYWEKEEYWEISMKEKNPRKIKSEKAAVVTEKIPINDNNDIKYDTFFKNRKIFSTEKFYTESEWEWVPETLNVNDVDILITEFKPNKEKKPPYYADDGKCNLILINIGSSISYKIIDEDVNCDTRLTISPDRKIITYRNINSEIWLMMSNFKHKKGLGVKARRFVWSQDSKSIFIAEGKHGEKLRWIRLYK